MHRIAATAVLVLALAVGGCNRSSDPPDPSPTAGVDQGGGEASPSSS